MRNARDLIKGPPVTCAPATPVSEAARLLTAHGIGSVVVADPGGAPLGIVIDRDLRRRVVARGLPGNTPVTAVMSSPLRSVGPAVLDTRLISTFVHGPHVSHSLEAVSERLGVTIIARHSALLDLLARRRITTLGELLEALEQRPPP